LRLLRASFESVDNRTTIMRKQSATQQRGAPAQAKDPWARSKEHAHESDMLFDKLRQ
jgi:hypothetical protein